MAQVILNNGTAPSTPAAGYVSIYSKTSDKRLYYKDDTGAEQGPLGTSATSAGSQASTSGTSIDFTTVPSGAMRVTIMFNGVSTNGSATLRIQLGSGGSFLTTGYTSTGVSINSSSGTAGSTDSSGFIIYYSGATNTYSGQMTLTLIGSNIWTSSHAGKVSTTSVVTGGGDVALSGALDRIRITTSNGTDTFDAGSINIIFG